MIPVTKAFLCSVVLLLASIAEGADVSPQLNSIASQQASLAAQQASAAAQQAAIDRQFPSANQQTDSAAKQRESVKKQTALLPQWKTPLAVVESAQPVALVQPAFDCAPLSEQDAEPLIHSAADRENLPADLLRAVIKQESGFRPCAISEVGAQGLMQLMPDTAYDLHVNNPFDPKQNVQGGAAYLKQLVNRYGGDLERALGAYNAGMARVDATDGVPDLFETRNYVTSILGRLGYTQVSTQTSVPLVDPPDARDDFHRLVLPPPGSVFPNTPNFSPFR